MKGYIRVYRCEGCGREGYSTFRDGGRSPRFKQKRCHTCGGRREKVWPLPGGGLAWRTKDFYDYMERIGRIQYMPSGGPFAPRPTAGGNE